MTGPELSRGDFVVCLLVQSFCALLEAAAPQGLIYHITHTVSGCGGVAITCLSSWTLDFANSLCLTSLDTNCTVYMWSQLSANLFLLTLFQEKGSIPVWVICVRVGLIDHCGTLPTQNVLWFCENCSLVHHTQ